MPGFNSTTLLGNLVRSPEMRYAKTGTSICTFTLAVNTRSGSGDNVQDEVLFIDITTFGRTADNCAQYLDKGSQALVSGRLRLEQWENQEGQKRSKISVIANLVQFLGRRGEQGTGSVPGPADTENLEDIPF